MKAILISLLTHERLIVRFLTAWSIGTMILFAARFISDAWLPDKFFRFLLGMAISPGECDIGSLSETIKTFLWNLLLTGGLCVAASFFALIECTGLRITNFPCKPGSAWRLRLA